MFIFENSLKRLGLGGCLCMCSLFPGGVLANESIYEIANIIENTYVIPEVAKNTSDKLRQKTKAGGYESYVNDSQQLAKILTQDLVKISQDEHIFVEYIGSSQLQKEQEESFEQRWLDRGPAVNYGVAKVEILKGNIGYFKYTSFYSLALAENSVSAAMDLLKHTDGMILDLRSNGGGDEDTANAFIATFLSESAEHPFRIEYRNRKINNKLPTSIPWLRYRAEHKLVILIDDKSFSAAEAVAFSLQEVGRAIVVGQTSAGGAHMLDPQMITGWFSVGIPDRRPIGRLSGKNWEGHGVVPDVNSSGDDALQVALSLF